ncbi:hypothetical protein ACIHEI_26895 [Kitasatospora sp. NPDC051984]|uniref:hypothetical protein n=1 Tax=Kitasatospora sp. NPDC051984 TaxID=3364059 RepID=UPI0037C680FA
MLRNVKRLVTGAAVLATAGATLLIAPTVAEAATYNGACGSGYNKIDSLPVAGGTVSDLQRLLQLRGDDPQQFGVGRADECLDRAVRWLWIPAGPRKLHHVRRSGVRLRAGLVYRLGRQHREFRRVAVWRPLWLTWQSVPR